jgi:hypothetical protein
MKSRTFYLKVTPELFIEALIEKGYCFGHIKEIKMFIYPEQAQINIYASGEIGKIKAIAFPEKWKVKVTVFHNNIEKVEKWRKELLSLEKHPDNVTEQSKIVTKLLTAFL